MKYSYIVFCAKLSEYSQIIYCSQEKLTQFGREVSAVYVALAHFQSKKTRQNSQCFLTIWKFQV